MSEKTAVWKTMPLASAVLLAIEKRQGVIIDDELINILSNEFGQVSKAEINEVLMELEIRGIIHVSHITKNKRRIEQLTGDKTYMAVGED
jgi:Fe2+ or Zn2+ uptake regulation protein